MPTCHEGTKPQNLGLRTSWNEEGAVCRYESKLAGEHETCVRLQGENGLLRQRFTSMAAELQALKGEIASLGNTKDDLLQASFSCPKDLT